MTGRTLPLGRGVHGSEIWRAKGTGLDRWDEVVLISAPYNIIMTRYLHHIYTYVNPQFHPVCVCVGGGGGGGGT